jgi:hypothetical protein
MLLVIVVSTITDKGHILLLSRSPNVNRPQAYLATQRLSFPTAGAKNLRFHSIIRTSQPTLRHI